MPCWQEHIRREGIARKEPSLSPQLPPTLLSPAAPHTPFVLSLALVKHSFLRILSAYRTRVSASYLIIDSFAMMHASLIKATAALVLVTFVPAVIGTNVVKARQEIPSSAPGLEAGQLSCFGECGPDYEEGTIVSVMNTSLPPVRSGRYESVSSSAAAINRANRSHDCLDPLLILNTVPLAVSREHRLRQAQG